MRAGLRRGAELLAGRRLGQEDLVAALHVRIDRLAGDEEMLDLARPFEDAVDAHVAHDPLDRIALLAARAQRLRGLVSASAADLHQVIDALPRHLGVEQLRHRRFETQIDVAAVGEAATSATRSLPSRTCATPSRRSSPRPLRACRSAAPHCTRSFAHSCAISSMRRPPAAQPAGIVRRPVFSVISASFRPSPSPQRRFSFGMKTSLKRISDVADAAQPHELAAVHDLDARRVRLDDERRDLLLLFAVDDLRRRLRHHDDQLGLRAVRAPQLLAVEDPALAVGRRHGASSPSWPDRIRRPARSARTRRSRPWRGAAGTSSSALACRTA